MGNPIRGRTRELACKVEATVPMNIHNRFDVEVIDSATGKIRQRAQAENVICSQLWTRLFAPNTYFNYIHYGTGSGTPAAANTSLFTFFGYGTPSTSDDVYNIDSTNGIFSLRRKITLSETAAVGSILTEVGIGYSTEAATLCTHAMLKDANGNQISIAKTNTDIINIYATVYVHYSPKNSAGIITFGNPDGLLKYLAGLYDSSYARPPVSAYVSHSNAVFGTTNTSSISAVYNSTSKAITLTMTRMGASSCNIAGGTENIILASYVSIVGDQAIVNNSHFCLESGGTWYSGTSIAGEAIGTGDGSTSNFAAAFPIDGSCTIYVDGVANGNVTIDMLRPKRISDMGAYFKAISSASTALNIIPVVGVAPSVANVSMPQGTTYFYNPNYSIGIKSFYSNFCAVEVSDDMVTWAIVCTAGAGGTVTVPTANQSAKFWRFTRPGVQYRAYSFTANVDSLADIHFSTVPASGAVITADYHTPVIAKDANHVFDLSVTIQLGEYTS